METSPVVAASGDPAATASALAWPISDLARKVVADQVVKMIVACDESGQPLHEPRVRLAAARVLVAMHRQNQVAEQLELRRRRRRRRVEKKMAKHAHLRNLAERLNREWALAQQAEEAAQNEQNEQNEQKPAGEEAKPERPVQRWFEGP